MGITEKLTTKINDGQVLQYVRDTMEFKAGRYQVRLPWKEDVTMGENKTIAEKRLMQLKKLNICHTREGGGQAMCQSGCSLSSPGKHGCRLTMLLLLHCSVEFALVKASETPQPRASRQCAVRTLRVVLERHEDSASEPTEFNEAPANQPSEPPTEHKVSHSPLKMTLRPPASKRAASDDRIIGPGGNILQWAQKTCELFSALWLLQADRIAPCRQGCIELVCSDGLTAQGLDLACGPGGMMTRQKAGSSLVGDCSRLGRRHHRELVCKLLRQHVLPDVHCDGDR
ncbi:hypothetical protein MTO96_024804 [Rhipicephalus appendiculatus]